MFSETMYGQSVNFAAFSLTTGTGSVVHMLTGGEVINSTTPTLTIKLTTDDLNALKAESTLCESRFTCLPRFDETFITDFAGNPVMPFSETGFNQRTIAVGFVPDSTPPNLVGFELDLQAGKLNLTFDEIISNVIPQRIVIQNAPMATTSYEITTSLILFTRELSVSLDLNMNDIFNLLGTAGLAKNINNTFITHNDELARGHWWTARK